MFNQYLQHTASTCGGDMDGWSSIHVVRRRISAKFEQYSGRVNTVASSSDVQGR
jgi:hypothetical protein